MQGLSILIGDNGNIISQQLNKTEIFANLQLAKEESTAHEQLLHQHTESIVSAAIHAVLPDVAVVRALQGYRFGTGKIVLVAAGKAAWQMANAASDCLGNRIADGVVVTKYGHIKGPIAHIRCFEGGHPVPDDGSCRGTQAALDLVHGLTRQDTVVFLLSGGEAPCWKSL